MLDRAKLYKELARVADDLFISYADEYAYARRMWDALVVDEHFAHRVHARAWLLPVPAWEVSLNTSFPVEQHVCADYEIVAVDGSQIYPDRHQGTSCYLINIGLVVMRYDQQKSQAHLHTEPHVFGSLDNVYSTASVIDLVNALREAYEFETAAEYMQRNLRDTYSKTLLAFDGSLIFWHLESKPDDFKDVFIQRYMTVLHALYNRRIFYAAYVSAPRHREVSNLIRLALAQFELETNDAWHLIDHVTDAQVMQFFLAPGTRSQPYIYTGNLRYAYGQESCPCFFYLHTGYEIARVEIPAWIARDRAACDLVASVLLDQADKGKGYPIALAEAHEQAVVKGPDRDFFYQLITRHGIQRNKRIECSLKSAKKKSIGV